MPFRPLLLVLLAHRMDHNMLFQSSEHNATHIQVISTRTLTSSGTLILTFTFNHTENIVGCKSSSLENIMAPILLDWTGKEEICRDLYLNQNRSLDEIMEYFRETEGFNARYVKFFTYLVTNITYGRPR